MKALFFFLAMMLCTVSAYAQVKTVHVTTAGSLSTLINTSEQQSLTGLTLTGNIDARDIAFVRDKLLLLSDLNLQNASIKAYSGDQGTNTGQTSVYYPANELPQYAFYNPYYDTFKPSLLTVVLPNNLLSVGELAFYFCWNLQTISIPASVKHISTYAFYGCYSLSSIQVASGNTNYSSSSGILFSKLKDSLLICPNAKSGSYSIPSGVKHIGASAFENCTWLSALSLPSTLISIGSYAFANCYGISGNLILPDNLISLEDGAFYNCPYLNGTVILPAGLSQLGYYCFLESNNIQAFQVNPANQVYSTQEGVLYSKAMDTVFICPGAKTGSFTIPETVKLIGSYAFYKCKQLSGSITIPAEVDYIAYYAFFGCQNISSYTVDATNAYFTAENNILFSKNLDRLLVCPPLQSGELGLSDSLKYIDPGALNNCSLLSGSVHLPADFSWIGDYAFYNCSGISGFSVHDDNLYFSANEGLLYNKAGDSVYICPLSKSGSLSLPESVRHIGTSAFDGCSKLSEILLPQNLTSIAPYAFEYCTGLSSFFIPQQLDELGYGALYNCTGLMELSIARTSPPLVGYYTLELIDKANCQLVVPTGCSSTYRNAPYWAEFSQIGERVFNALPAMDRTAAYLICNTEEGIKIAGLKPGEWIEIFSSDATLSKRYRATAPTEDIQLSGRGIFIVKIGAFTEKIKR